MREFKSISASQVSKHDECKRAWWFQYIMGLPVPQKASAALGEAMHAQLEKYLNDGTPPDESTPAGRIAKAGLKFLPKPGTVFTEVPMSNKKKREEQLARARDYGKQLREKLYARSAKQNCPKTV